MCLTLCDLMECSHQVPLSRSTFEARSWVSSALISLLQQIDLPNQDWIHISCIFCIGGWILYYCTTWEAFQNLIPLNSNLFLFHYSLSYSFVPNPVLSLSGLPHPWTSHLFIIFLVPITSHLSVIYILCRRSILWLPSKVYLPINVVLKTQACRHKHLSPQIPAFKWISLNLTWLPLVESKFFDPIFSHGPRLYLWRRPFSGFSLPLFFQSQELPG